MASTLSSKLKLPARVFAEIKRFIEDQDMSKPQIKISPGSSNGDNYSGDVFRVIAVPENGVLPEDSSTDRSISQQEMHLFVKLAPTSEFRRTLYKTSFYFQREKYMYEVVLPRYEQFQRQYLSKDDLFNNYPQILMADLTDNQEFIVLNDLRREGYLSPYRSYPLTMHQCRLVLNNLAKFHAISYAFKDQQPKEFSQLTSKLVETMFLEPISEEMTHFLQKKIEYGLRTLPDDNETIYLKAHLRRFGDSFGENMASCVGVKDYGVICHGDTWISNLVFRFKNNKEHEMKLLDWQMSRHTTPILDLSYFIFCCTDDTLRLHLPQLLNEYYNNLIRRINELGSSGIEMYPRNIFEEHCQKYMKYGLGLALMTLHAVTCKSTEIPNVTEVLENQNLEKLDQISDYLVTKPAYIKRMSGVIRDAVKFGYI